MIFNFLIKNILKENASNTVKDQGAGVAGAADGGTGGGGRGGARRVRPLRDTGEETTSALSEQQ